MYKYFFVIVTSSCALTTSCQPKSKESVFDEFKKTYPFLNNYQWQVDYGGEDSGGTVDAMAHTKYSDTTLQVILNKTFGVDREEVFDIQINKMYSKNNSEYVIALDEKLKPKYEYKQLSSGDKVFLFGKYLYLSESNRLTKGQQKYFMEHSDSLWRIAGDSLPKLPSKN